jgi:acyl dehydratase
VADSLTRLEGRQGRPFRMVVEEGKCREFARATTPLSWSATHPVSDVRAPVTFLTSVRFWMAPEDSAWHGVERDYRRVLHGEQEFTFTDGPVRIGEELTATERIDRTYEKQGSRGTMQFTETVTDFVTRDADAAVASMRATSITLPAPVAGNRWGADATASDPRPAGRVEGRDELGVWTDSPLTITDFVRYQGASGDFNPIHHDPAFAQAAGYPGPFAVGMLTAGFVATLLAEYDDLDALVRYTTRWKTQAWPGDALTYRIFEDDRRFDDPALHTLGVDVLRPDGQVHMHAWAGFARR